MALLILLGTPSKAILADPHLDRDAKRAKLAAWASDAYTVRDRPTLRRLDDGTVVMLQDILRALQSLDDLPQQPPKAQQRVLMWRAMDRRRKKERGPWRWPRRFLGNDDDDPPPCPATIKPRPVDRGGPAFAAPVELACA